jgi:hypothetical protein
MSGARRERSLRGAPERSEQGAERAREPRQAPGKRTRVEQGAAAATAAPAAKTAGADERATDWRVDEQLLAAMGLGDLFGSGHDATMESPARAAGARPGDDVRHAAALAAAAEDRAAHARDPVVLYLAIHSNAVARAVAAMLRAHVDEWPRPATQLQWTDAAGFTRALTRWLCPVVRDDSFALFALVHPLRPDDAYLRHVAGAQVARTTWIPGFGDAVAAQVKAATFASLARLGPRFQVAAQAGGGELPQAAQIVCSHPLDSYVRFAMAVEGVLDVSTVWRAPEQAAHGERAKPPRETKPHAALTFAWLGRQDATLWNYVRVSPSTATAEEVAAALYGDAAQSRMAFALQRHGDLFQVAPKYARALIASRFPGEVTGHGTARDGAAMVRSPLGAAQARREALRPSPSPETPPERADEEPIWNVITGLHASIWQEYDRLRQALAPLPLASRLEPGLAFHQRSLDDAAGADDAERRRWAAAQREWLDRLRFLSARVLPLVAELHETPAAPARTAALRARLAEAVAAAAAAHVPSTGAALLAQFAARDAQAWLEQATDAQIGLRDARRQATAMPGQLLERGSDEADAALTRAQAHVLRGGDASGLEDTRLTAEEVALRTRMETVRLALIDLSLATDDAGHGLSAQLAACCSGRFRSLPKLIDDVQLRLHEVERTWASGERAASTSDAAADEQEAKQHERRARAAGLNAARAAFRTIAKDQDISAFLRDAQRVVGSQQFRSGLARLAGALVLTVVTSGVAAELGAGVAGLVGGGEAVGAVGAGALAARAVAVTANVAVNVTVNSALQVVLSEGRDAMGWALIENALMELGSRGLTRTLRGPLTQLRALEQQALRDGQRLRELTTMERAAARRGQELEEALTQERHALAQARADRAGWFVIDLSLEMVLGMASQWAARALLRSVRGYAAGGPGAAEVSDDVASEVLQQGAAILLGKRLASRNAAWQARRAELEAQAWFATLPEARALREQRRAFFDDAGRLAQRTSPEPSSGLALLARHEELIRLEQALIARGQLRAGAHIRHARAAVAATSRHAHRERAEAAALAEAPARPRHPRGPNPTPVGLFGDDTHALAAARHLPPLEGYLDVFVHASPDRFEVHRLDRDATVTPRQLAAYLRRQGRGGQRIRLIACSAGQHPEAVAQQLADVLGVEVMAADRNVWTGPNGELGIGDVIGNNEGAWHTFAPRKPETPPAKLRAKQHEASQSSGTTAPSQTTTSAAPSETPEPRRPAHAKERTTPLERERTTPAIEYDAQPPEVTFTPHADRRARIASAAPRELAALQAELGAPLVVDPQLTDGVRVLARRVRRLIGFDLVVREVRVGREATVADVQAHARTVADIERYNGVIANLRALRERMSHLVQRLLGRRATRRHAPEVARLAAAGKLMPERPVEELPFLYARGSRGWVTELELRKLHALLEARSSPLHQDAVDSHTLHEELRFLHGRLALHEEVLRSMDETEAFDHADGPLLLERPDTGEVTREALAQGYRLPGPEDGARPEWYYYRSIATSPGRYELARRPSSPVTAPGFRARFLGDTFTGLEPLGVASDTEIPHTLSARDVIDHLRNTPGFGQYLRMLQTEGLASVALLEGVIQHKFNLLGMSGKRVTTERLRADIRDHFRERVRAHLCDPTLGEIASWQRFRDMRANLSAVDRGILAEIWYRDRHVRGGQGPTRVDVARTSGKDEGKTQRRVVDAVEGRTAIEIKDVVGFVDRDQFEAYLDMLKAPTDGSAPLFKKVKYVFTNPEGAIANLEFMATAMSNRRIQGKLTVECFDRQGRKHVVTSPDAAMRLLASMKAAP